MSSLPELSAAETARYSRHILLPEIDVEGQQRLKAARVLVIGAGGLGSPVSLYLAAAGIGTIGMADFDQVEMHNLQRQIVHGTSDVGRPKTESAAARLRELNPHVTIVQHCEGIHAENAVELFEQYDVIVDGTDNFPTRYLNTDAAFFARRPLVYGSIFKFEGQVTVFDPHGGGPCYRCLFPEPPPPGSVPNCGEAGVLGALCGVIGSLQAMEAIKRLAGIEGGLVGRLIVFDALAMEFRRLNLRKDPDCPLCGPRATIRAIAPERYAGGCAPMEHALEVAARRTTGGKNAAASAEASEDANGFPFEIDVHTAADMARRGAMIVDVREPFELKICQVAGARHIPMRQIPDRIDELNGDAGVLVLCHSGVRSRHVTEWLRARGVHRAANIRGGIDAWARELDPSMLRY